MELLKKTEEYRVETEQEAQDFIEEVKNAAAVNGYELTSYSSTHRYKKDKDYYQIKIVKTY